MTKLFIPTKIKVGFQKRSDTFTGQLAYIIYYDEKGVLRKQTSWDGWRDSKIEALEFDNTPQANFVLNKGVQRYGHWGSGRSVVRVHDNRNFEFEISIDNLIGILMHSDVSKRDIVEECIYAWAGKELVLLPVNSEEYKESIKYTAKQSTKVSTKDLKPGIVYAQKKHDKNLTYIGYYPYYEYNYYYSSYSTDCQKSKGKKHIFHDGKNFVIPAPTVLSHAITDEVVENYATLVDDFFSSPYSGKILKLSVNPKEIILQENAYYNTVPTCYKAIDDNHVIMFSRIQSYSSDPTAKFDITNFRLMELKVGEKETNFIDHYREKSSAWSASVSNRGYGYYNNYNNSAYEAEKPKWSVDAEPYFNELKDAIKVLDPDDAMKGIKMDVFAKAFIKMDVLTKALTNLGYGNIVFSNEHNKQFEQENY